MTRVFPLPAPARISTGPSVVSTASRCCGLSWSKKDKAWCCLRSLIRIVRVQDIQRSGYSAFQEFGLPFTPCHSERSEESASCRRHPRTDSSLAKAIRKDNMQQDVFPSVTFLELTGAIPQRVALPARADFS